MKIPEEVEIKEESPGRRGRGGGGGEDFPFHPRGEVEVKIGVGCAGARDSPLPLALSEHTVYVPPTLKLEPNNLHLSDFSVNSLKAV